MFSAFDAKVIILKRLFFVNHFDKSQGLVYNENSVIS